MSEQTVARRFRRLRADGLVRVVGLVVGAMAGQTDWSVRIHCRPGSAATTAAALAQRPEVSWVSIVAGGSEITALIRGSSGLVDVGGDLLSRLPRVTNVLGVSAHATLHRFGGSGAVDWVGLGDLLDDEQSRQLVDPEPVAEPGAIEPLSTADRPLLDLLARDGRATYAALAAATGWPQARVTRRIAGLMAAGILYFDVDVAISLVGFASIANLWLTVAPAHLVAVGEELADHVEIAFVGAITGSANLLATAVTTDAAALYRYVTTKVAAIDAVRQMEISPVLTRVKQANSLVENGRLCDPPPPSRPARPASGRR